MAFGFVGKGLHHLTSCVSEVISLFKLEREFSGPDERARITLHLISFLHHPKSTLLRLWGSRFAATRIGLKTGEKRQVLVRSIQCERSLHDARGLFDISTQGKRQCKLPVNRIKCRGCLYNLLKLRRGGLVESSLCP